MESVERLLQVVRRELAADDARVEIGGRDPDDPRQVWCRTAEGWRVVALFDESPEEPGRVREKLEALVDAFREMMRSRMQRPHGGLPPQRALDDEIGALCERTGAVHGMLIDDSSPIVWGSADLQRSDEEDVDVLLADAALAERVRKEGLEPADLLVRSAPEAVRWLSDQGLERRAIDPLVREARQRAAQNESRDRDGWTRHFRMAEALAQVRAGESPPDGRQQDRTLFVRKLEGIYQLLLVFEAAFSELHVEAAVMHVVPKLERLLRALPPVDPGSGGGGGGGRQAKVLQLWPRA
jgi:hypothetical protein